MSAGLEKRRGWRWRLLKTMGIAAAAYAGLVGIAKLTYRSMLYPAPRTGLATAPRGCELRAFLASDGEPVQAAVYGGDHARTLVFFHGNGESIENSVGIGREVARHGMRFVAVEYRGYGASPSSGPNEQGLYADARGVLDALIEGGTPAEAITLWGNSLGSGVAVEMITHGLASRLVLQSAYTSIPEVAQRVAPFLPAKWLMTDRFASLEKADRVTVPTLVVHGDQDALVPHHMGVALSEAIAGAELMTVEGGQHNDVLAHPGVLERIIAFAKNGN